jgi:hypothetical protein
MLMSVMNQALKLSIVLKSLSSMKEIEMSFALIKEKNQKMAISSMIRNCVFQGRH